MPPRTLSEQIEGLVAALPATGEVNYRTFYESAVSSENRAALQIIHDLKRQGRVKMRTVLDETTGKYETFVSRGE